MNIDKFKNQHEKIYECIDALRRYATAGVTENAREIAKAVVAMSSVIKLHLAVEDTVLYPALRHSESSSLARLGDQFQDEMKAIANSYDGFVRRWNTAGNVAKDPEGFRADANRVLKTLYGRIRREDRDFYPEIEAL
ncbi:hemerythrin domain-containing protein [Herbaspirillum sp. HC18]|nr:hemerythrin domain-containing protein [Herbaspirillum sp. HC18]